MPEITFDGRTIGGGAPCFVIAEAGVNHNGDIALARRLVDAAAAAGADAVKFQTWITEELVSPDAPMAPYQERNLGGGASQFEMLKGLELAHDAFIELSEHATSRNILFLSTPDEERSADFLAELGVPLFKVGSAEVPNLPFLRHVARKRRSIILSTGMSTLDEVAEAVRVIEEEGDPGLVLLQCVSSYPADPADANLRAMATLEWFGHPVGFSDHTLGIDVAIAAVALGACVLEKHLTLDTSLPGPDHSASLDPDEFAKMVTAIRVVESALGSGEKRVTPAEAEARDLMRKTIVARREIPAGALLSDEDLVFRRAAGGLSVAQRAQVVGRRVRRTIAAGEPVTLEALA